MHKLKRLEARDLENRQNTIKAIKWNKHRRLNKYTKEIWRSLYKKRTQENSENPKHILHDIIGMRFDGPTFIFLSDDSWSQGNKKH